MLASSIVKTGLYWSGNNPWIDDLNPKGYFENPQIHNINEAVLETCMPSPLVTLGKSHPATKFAPNGERWLGLLEDWAEPLVRDDHSKMIANYLAKCPNDKPFVLKDPRFSYALPAWMPQLNSTIYICVFRDPLSVANSIVRMCSHFTHLQPMGINVAYALNLWECINRYILDNLSRSGNWLFIHARQILDKNDRQRIEERIGHSLNKSFLDSNIIGHGYLLIGYPPTRHM